MPVTAKHLIALTTRDASDIANFMKRTFSVSHLLNEFVRVIDSSYRHVPFESGPNPTRFSSHSPSHSIIYGSWSLATAI